MRNRHYSTQITAMGLYQCRGHCLRRERGLKKLRETSFTALLLVPFPADQCMDAWRCLNTESYSAVKENLSNSYSRVHDDFRFGSGRRIYWLFLNLKSIQRYIICLFKNLVYDPWGLARQWRHRRHFKRRKSGIPSHFQIWGINILDFSSNSP